MFTTNLQIHIVTCCIHLHIHHTSRTPYLFHSFSDFVVYVVTTLIFPKNQRQCAEKISGPNRSIKITDHFTCTSANVIYCITCTYCNKLYIGETGRRLGDRFREHLRDVERNDKDASKPVARHFNLPNHSKQLMAVCGLSLHLGSSESRKTLEQKFIFQIGTLDPHGIKRALFIQLI